LVEGKTNFLIDSKARRSARLAASKRGCEGHAGTNDTNNQLFVGSFEKEMKLALFLYFYLTRHASL
jgi:hypothetical protein